MKIEGSLDAIGAECAAALSLRIKKSERFWKFIIQNSPVLLTWMGLIIWIIIRQLLGVEGQ